MAKGKYGSSETTGIKHKIILYKLIKIKTIKNGSSMAWYT